MFRETDGDLHRAIFKPIHAKDDPGLVAFMLSAQIFQRAKMNSTI
jgi:hypothetical protein